MTTNKREKVTAEQICQEFYFQYFRVCRQRFVKRESVQYQKAMKNPKMVLAFEKCANIINEYSLDHVDYIGNTFEHYKKYIHPKTLINMSNLTRYKVTLDERNSAQRTSDIYNKIIKSVRFVALICKANEFKDVGEFFKYCVQNDALAPYLLSGKISKYYLAMFNNIDKVCKLMSVDSYGDLKQIVLNHREQLNLDARNAIKTFTGNEKISIIQITNHNIQKNIGG